MKNIKLFETFLKGSNGELVPSVETQPTKGESLGWWNSLQPHEQQEIVAKYLPENDFGALSVTDDEISLLHQLVLREK
jgi:hypothetical protein